MTNQEIREAITRMFQIKSLKEEENNLRMKIIKEMKRRRKTKLDLGGPNQEDYVCLREEEFSDIVPSSLLTYLMDKASDAGLPKENALPLFLSCIAVVKKKISENLGESELNHIRSFLPVQNKRSHEFLTYKISTDDKNQMRGIDL